MKNRNYQVKQLAEIAGVSTDAIRFYSKKGLLKPKRNSTNNYQLYDDIDLIRLQFIVRAKLLGYNLNEIKKIIYASERKETPCPMVREIIKDKIIKNKKQLNEAIKLQRRMETALKKWEQMDDAIPVGKSICHLIESDI